MPKSTVVPDVVLPELDVTLEDQKSAYVYNVSPVCDGESERLKTSEECCRERQLLSALTQLAELRAASEEALNHSDCQGDCASESCSNYQLRMILERLPHPNPHQQAQ